MRGSGVEVADIFRQYGPDYRESHNMPRNQWRAMGAIEACRTSLLGGHRDKCDNDDCGHIKASYNSCRNRHCPECQSLKKEKWIEARIDDLLPIQYFHVVFTIPAELKPVVLMNQKIMYNILFRAVSETLITLAETRLGLRIGFMSILHTWGQNLMEHPHIHCVVTGGGLSLDERRWVSCGKKFFLPVKIMSELFKDKLLDFLKESYHSNQLILTGSISNLIKPHVFQLLLIKLYNKKWVAYCKPPFNGINGVLEYLSRYTHRIAISNNRILNSQDGMVTFKWRDYADHDRVKVLPLKAGEFIRRFLLHVLPDRFVKVRYFGLLANRRRKYNIALCRLFLGSNKTETIKDKPKTWQELMLEVSGVDVTRCPICRKGRMVTIEVLQPFCCNDPPGKC